MLAAVAVVAGLSYGGWGVTGALSGNVQWPQFTPSDTYAQWAMVFLTLLATGVSVFAIVLVRATLWETRRGNEIAKMAGEAQVRAYLSVDTAKYGAFTSGLNCYLTLKNSGQSPAIGIKVEAKVFSLKEGSDPFKRETHQWSHIATGEAHIIPAGSVQSATIIWIKDGWEQGYQRVPQGSGYFEIVGHIIWTDVFSVQHSLDFVLWPKSGAPHARLKNARIGEMYSSHIADWQASRY